MIPITEWWVLTILLAPALLFQWYILIKFFIGSKTTASKQAMPDMPVSLIICARNELSNLQKNLPLWLNQKYSKYEVIVVNDRSWDDSRFYLEGMAAQHPNLRIVTVPDNENYWTGKKLALTLGIKAATHDTLLLTDADCAPAGDEWMASMIQGYSVPNCEIVLGYGRYAQHPGLLNLVIRFETLQTGWLYIASARAGAPFMAVGRNLSYKKELFFKIKGFYRHMHIASGDDDLFINEVATRSNTQVVVHPKAVTISIPKKTWADYIYQRRRHFTTSSHFKTSTKVYLAWFQLSRLVIWAFTLFSLAGLAVGQVLYAIPFALGSTYFMLRWWSMVRLGKKGGEDKLGWWYPLMSWVIFMIQVRIWLQNTLLGVPKGWKKA